MKEKTPLIDHIGSFIGIVVIGFILFILAWPIIDPTPNKSSTLKEKSATLNNTPTGLGENRHPTS